MATAIATPPTARTTDNVKLSGGDKTSIHFYLEYEYLPLETIAQLITGVNKLYEMVYEILYDEKVPANYRLKLDYASTKNSFDWIGKFIDAIRPSRKALIALAVAAGIIVTPFGVEKYRRDAADRHHTEALTRQVEAETGVKISQRESLDLDNLMKRQKLTGDSLARVNEEKNKKRILRQRKAIKKTINNTVIYNVTVNNTNIINRKSEADLDF